MPLQQITATDILNGTITGSDIASGTITGSNISANTISNTAFQTGSVENYMSAQGSQLGGMRNRIINGAMMIDQRNAGASVTVTGGGFYAVDRFICSKNGTVNNFTAQQITGGPSGFSKCLLATMGTGVTPASTDYMLFQQSIEGLNFADMNFGTSSAKTFTLSFWVYSSVAGTFGVGFRNATAARSYVASYSIPSSNTWTYITLTIPGDTTGTWSIDNTIGINVVWDLGIGSTYSTTAGSWQAGNYFGLTGGTKLAATTGATFYITGVQLEKGATATPFENRLYGTELALCQRYYQFIGGDGTNKFPIACGYGAAGSGVYITYTLPVQMRTTPTLTQNGTWTVDNSSQPQVLQSYSNSKGISIQLTPNITGRCYCFPDTSDDTITCAAEL